MERTAEQARADNLAKMGSDLGAIYSALWQEVAWLHKKWSQYVELFGTSEARVALLNETAPSTFHTIQDVMWEDILLSLARLADSPISKGRHNLSVHRLAQVVRGTPIGDEVQSLADEAKLACGFARDWRNRRIAHRDLSLALGQSAAPLAPASRLAVKTALIALAAPLNAVSRHFRDSSTMFELGFGENDSVSLLHVLRDGLQFEKGRFAHLKSGALPMTSMIPEPL